MLGTELCNNLSDVDGLKLIGQCPNISTLRAIEPIDSGERIFVKEYHSGTGIGGGVFIYDSFDTTSTDDAGIIIVTPKGGRWKRECTVATPEFFGAIGDNIKDDTMSLQLTFDSGFPEIRGAGKYKLANQNRTSSAFPDKTMAYNYILRINNSKSSMDFSKAIFTVPSGVPRITAIEILNSSGEIKFPLILGNMQETNVRSGYIDDCAIRIGANCRNLTVICNGIDHYPGHGIIVRHYIQDGVTTLNDGIPYNITIKATGIRHCWQSGIVLITGDTLKVTDSDVQYSGSNENAGSLVGIVGHGIHLEPVASAGGTNNRLKNITVINNSSANNTMNGFMCHTAIDNLRSELNNFRFNLLDGAHYEGYAHCLHSNSNTCSYNGRYGIYFNCGTLIASGYPELLHDASFNDTCENNGLEGFIDLSGSKSLVISGTFGRNGGSGILLQKNGKQTLANVMVYDNGKNSTTTKYGINGGNSIMSNVRIYNTAPSIYNQKSLNMRAAHRGVNIFCDNDSTIADVLDGHPLYCTANDGSVRMQTNIGIIAGRKLILNPKGPGSWLMPDSFDSIYISFVAKADMKFPSPSELNIGVEFFVEVGSGSGALFKVGTGTVNEITEVMALPDKKYRLYYDSLTNLSVIEL